MKNIFRVFLVLAMFFSVVFVFETTAANAQVTVKRKSTNAAKYVYRKGKAGTRYVYRKGKQGTIYVGRQTWRGGKWTFNKSKSGVKKGIGVTKKVITGEN